MARREDLQMQSNDKITMLKVVLWKPEGEIRAILQISHGMVEHIERYSEFAAFLADNGIMVVGSDHLGHGESLSARLKKGYFCEKDPSGVVVDDLYKITKGIRKMYPNIPYFIFGHSMGSFIVRNYITEYGEDLAGAIICGTGDIPNFKAKSGLLLIKILTLFKGSKYRSKFINNMALGNNNKHFTEPKFGERWLTKDEEKVREYMEDPKCGFIFTLNGYRTLMESIIKNNKTSKRLCTPEDLPLLIISGADCPLGEFGEGIKRVYKKYKKAGIKDITWKLYENDRHEILNETDRDVVYNDILGWINKKIKQRGVEK